MRTGDIKLIKKVNQKLVFDLIRSHSVISGADLSRITGLQPSTILKILKNLSSKHLIVNTGKGDSTIKGGKRPNLWKLNNSAAYVIGLDIELNEMTAVMLDLSSNTVSHTFLKTGKILDPEDLLNKVNQIVENILYISQVDKEKILGMGIAYAGVVNCDSGVIVLGDIISQTNVPLQEELKKFHKFPIKIENNANATAIGEKWVGIAEDKKNFMTILIEFDTNVSGIGIGIMINGNLYHGSSYCAGEINIHLPKLQELLSNMSEHLSESPILQNYISSLDKIDIHLMIEAARKGDKVAALLFSIYGDILGKTISKAVSLLNPDAIIISGPVSSLEELIIAPVREAVKKEILSITNDTLEILCSKHGDFSVATGAASIILYDYFRHPLYD
jgi:N-acetylglucosamine repressor